MIDAEALRRRFKPQPCPNCPGTIRAYGYGNHRDDPQVILLHGKCDRCTTGSIEFVHDVQRDPPPARRPERKRHLTAVPPLPARRDGSQLRYLRSIPSAVYVPLVSGRDVHRGGMVRCPWHANGEERTPSLHVRDDDGGWYCHGCWLKGGILEFYCYLTGRELSAGGREFARLIDEVDDALRRAT